MVPRASNAPVRPKGSKRGPLQPPTTAIRNVQRNAAIATSVTRSRAVMLMVIAASSTTMKMAQIETTVNSSLMLPIMAMNCC